MNKKIKLLLVTIILVALAFSLRAEIAGFFGSFHEERQERNTEKWSYNYYYSDYKNANDDESVTWNITDIK